jgi:hypothetical protein
MKGVTATYSGPLWRLLASSTAAWACSEQGIHYDDLTSRHAGRRGLLGRADCDGRLRRAPASLIAHDDRFIVAFKKDGCLDSSSEGMRFVYDDSVSSPMASR